MGSSTDPEETSGDEPHDDDSRPLIEETGVDLALSVDECIERIGMGPFQFRILVAAGMCFASDAMQVLNLSFLSIVLKSEWTLSRDEAATISASIFAGSFLGTLVLGPMADKHGRRPIFLLTGSLISLFGFATSFVSNFSSLVSMIALVGFGVGGLTVPFDILAEFVPSSHRGKNLLLIEYFWTLGTMLVPVAAWFCFSQSNSWRLFVVLCTLPCLISTILGAILVPESPRWLITQDRAAEATSILCKAASINGLDPGEIFPEPLTLQPEHHEESRLMDLLSQKWRRLTLCLWGVWIGSAFLYYGTIFTVSQVFDRDGTNERALDHHDKFDYSAIFTACSAELFGITLVVLTVDKFGRILSQAVSAVMGGLSVALLGFLGASSSPSRNFLIVAAFSARLFMMSGSCTTWVSTAEILPTEIRTTGHSAANALGRVGAFLSPYALELCSDTRSIGALMLVVSTVATICILQLPETRGTIMGSGQSRRLSSSSRHEA